MYGDYDIKCKVCGQRRGNHYSKVHDDKALTFCSLVDSELYMETGVVKDNNRTFIPVNTTERLHKYKSELIENTTVIMNETDPRARKGQIGTIICRDSRLARIKWNNGGIYFHPVKNISPLKNIKDPNLLFLMEKTI